MPKKRLFCNIGTAFPIQVDELSKLSSFGQCSKKCSPLWLKSWLPVAKIAKNGLFCKGWTD